MKTRKTLWAGKILTGLVTLALLGSAIGKIAGAAKMVDGLTRVGIPHALVAPIGVLELFCLALYLLPRTAMLGTLLATGFFGGATLTHIIGGESIVPPLAVGLLIWGGAWFRIGGLRNLLPMAAAVARGEQS
jgi:hypothetical protein